MVRLVKVAPRQGPPVLINAAHIQAVGFGGDVTAIHMVSGVSYLVEFPTGQGPGDILRYLFGSKEGSWEIIE